MRAFPLLLLALAATASAAPLIGRAADLRSTPLCQAYTCTLIKTHTATSPAGSVIVPPGGNVAQYSLTAGATVFDVWVSRNAARKVTDVRARPRMPLTRDALPAAAELIRVTADISPPGAAKAAQEWLGTPSRPDGRRPERLFVTPWISINAGSKDGILQITLHDQ